MTSNIYNSGAVWPQHPLPPTPPVTDRDVIDPVVEITFMQTKRVRRSEVLDAVRCGHPYEFRVAAEKWAKENVTVLTTAELDALPAGSVIISVSRGVRQIKTVHGTWAITGVISRTAFEDGVIDLTMPPPEPDPDDTEDAYFDDATYNSEFF